VEFKPISLLVVFLGNALNGLQLLLNGYTAHTVGLGPHLFVKVPRPGDSEVTFAVFESSFHLLLPV